MREIWFMHPRSRKRRLTKWPVRRSLWPPRDGGEDQGTEEWERKTGDRPSESGEALKSPDTRQTISPSFCYLCLFCSRCAEGAGQGKSWPSVNTPSWKPLSGPDWLVLAEISSSPPPSPARAVAFCSLAGLILPVSLPLLSSSVSWTFVVGVHLKETCPNHI